jgi:CRISPR/Cas system-associated endonuclease Cas1
LHEYRKRCSEEGAYNEAERTFKKIEEVQEKELRRQKHKLLLEQKHKVSSINELQQNKLLQFTQAWNDYTQKYEHAALSSLEKLKAKHLRELKLEEGKIRHNYLKPSKKVIELKSKEKSLAKQKKYFEAEKLRKTIERIEVK